MPHAEALAARLAQGFMIPLLAPQDCAHWVQQVHALREHWIQRDEHGRFFTLGAASYLDTDAERLDRHYRSQAAALNPTLQASFAPLYRQLTECMQSLLQAPVFLDPSIGLPGFHVFQHDEDLGNQAPSIHVDRQYQYIRWPEGHPPRVDEQISLTLPLRLPASGGGLRVWDMTERRLAELPRWAGRALVPRVAPTMLQYRIGELVVHDGHHFHQIAPTPDPQRGDERLTLQAHALPFDGRGWLLYF